MLYQTLLLSLPAFATYVRYDRTSLDGFGKKTFSSPPENSQREGVLPQLADPFKIYTNCQTDKLKCEQAAWGVQNSANNLALKLYITKEIKIQITVGPLCPDATSVCQFRNTLAYAQSNALFPITTKFQKVLYPQALVKQISQSDLNYTEYDIVASFDSSRNWFFNNGTKDTILENQYDFEYIAGHELLHGLGLLSALKVDVNSSARSSQIKSKQTSSTELREVNTPLEIVSKAGLKSYDVDPGDKTRTYTSYEDGLYVFDFFVSSNSNTQSTANSERPLYFNAKDNKALKIYNPVEYRPGSSLSHLGTDPSISDSADAMMQPAVGAGVSIPVVIGPKTLLIMETIGWPSINSPSPSYLNFDIEKDVSATSAQSANSNQEILPSAGTKTQTMATLLLFLSFILL
jgi:hypothetical protein